MLRTQPCLALIPQSIPHARTGALLGGGERTSDGPQHVFLGCIRPAHCSHLHKRIFQAACSRAHCSLWISPSISHLRDSKDRTTPKATQTAETATIWGRSLIYMRTLTSHKHSQAAVSKQPVPVLHFERCPVCHHTVHTNQESSVPASVASS